MECNTRKKTIVRQPKDHKQKSSLTFAITRAAASRRALNTQQVNQVIAAAQPSYLPPRPEIIRSSKRKLALAFREIKRLKGNLVSLEIKYDRRGSRLLGLEGGKRDITRCLQKEKNASGNYQPLLLADTETVRK